MILLAIALGGCLLAYANGANDNFKGVATLFGSGTATYRSALLWTTVTTLAGSIAALLLARGLLAAFSGKGLVPTSLVSDPAFPAAVALAAGGTVLLATRLGFPISTTHALIGGLVGAGLVGAGGTLSWGRLGDGFLLPLLTSPFLAILLAAAVYPPLRWLRRYLRIDHETCVCVGREVVATVPGTPGAAAAMRAVPSLAIDSQASCRVRYQGQLLGLPASRALDTLHYLSGGAVCFARGLNDTPKIAALLLIGGAIAPNHALLAVAVVMAAGGLLAARRVADTMAHRIASLNPGQGLSANLVTALLVIGASNFGLPVSTTHVSCGALFGIGAATGQAHWSTIGRIALAWLITLPLAGVLGAIAMAALT